MTYMTIGKAKMNYTLETLVSDLDRCPHGRHEGDTCSWGPGDGAFDGHCPGGVSLGNPLLPPGRIIGVDYSRSFMIRVPVDRHDRHDARGWYIPLSAAREVEFREAVEVASGRGLDG